MTAKRFLLVGLGLYAVLSVADFVLTFGLIRLSDGIAYEANPVAALWLDRFGWPGLAAFKAVGVVVFVVSMAIVASRRPRVAVVVTTLGCGVLLWVTSYSQQLIDETRRELATRDAAWGPPPPDPLKEPFLGLFASR